MSKGKYLLAEGPREPGMVGSRCRKEEGNGFVRSRGKRRQAFPVSQAVGLTLQGQGMLVPGKGTAEAD